jgi:hypothetical protein
LTANALPMAAALEDLRKCRRDARPELEGLSSFFMVCILLASEVVDSPESKAKRC